MPFVNEESFNLVLKIFKKFNLAEEQGPGRWSEDEPEAKLLEFNARFVKFYCG